MPSPFDNRLIVAISSRALFDLSESHGVYEAGGVEAYQQHQVAHEDELLQPGVAFELTRKLLRLNEAGHQHVEVVLLSRNSADTGLRVFNAISHYKLGITRAVFTSGRDTSRYVPALGTHLFLSADPEDVRHALESGHAAATIVPRLGYDHSGSVSLPVDDELRIAFDGDAVPQSQPFVFRDLADFVFGHPDVSRCPGATVSALRTRESQPVLVPRAFVHQMSLQIQGNVMLSKRWI